MNVPNDNELKQLEESLREPLSRFMVNPISSQDTMKLLNNLQSSFDKLKPGLTFRNKK